MCIFGCITMLLIQIFFIAKKRINESSVKKIPIVVNGGRITKIVPIHKSTLRKIYYNYTIHEKQYSGTYAYGLEFNRNINKLDFHVIYEKSIPVIIEKENPENSVMLLHPKEYKEYRLSFPDSLRWILPLLKK